MFRTIKQAVIVSTIVLITGCLAPGHRAAFDQFNESHQGPVFSVQGYVVSGQSDQLREAWQALTAEMRKHPGFVSSRVSTGIGDSELILVHSEWRSLEDLRNVFSQPEVLRLEEKMPASQRKFEHLFSNGNLGELLKNPNG